MAMNVTPFVGTDNFNMETFNNMISQINNGVNGEISEVLAQLGTKAKIQTGSYVGTGTYGADNPCSLTFDTLPKLIWFYAQETGTGSNRDFYFVTSNSSANPFLIPNEDFSVNLYSGASGGFRNYNVYQKVEGNTVFWWSTNESVGKEQQGNIANNTYYYIAFM